MAFLATLMILLTVWYTSVGLFGTMAQDTNCQNSFLGAQILEKVISIELKSDLALSRLDTCQLTRAPEEHSRSTERTPLQPNNDALRVADLEYDGWQLVFRATAGNGQNVYNAWTKGDGTSNDKPESMERSNAINYRSLAVSAWSLQKVNMVKFAMYNRDKEVAYVIFDGQASDYNNWFTKSRVVSSSWPDLTNTHEFKYFSIDGDAGLNRRFFINRHYNGCDNDLGHIAVLDTNTNIRCKWDRQPLLPQFLYSQINSADYWNAMQFGRADYMAIFIRTEH